MQTEREQPDHLYTKEDLRTMQAWPLWRKIQVTQTRIMEWFIRYEGNVYVSFSGGKDSTVLLDLARRIYPDIEAVFVDTGLEYPEIRNFVRTKENVIIRRPKMTFSQVIKTFGYPIISKTVAHNVGVAIRNPDGAVKRNMFSPEKHGPYAMYKWSYLLNAPFKISEKCCDIMKKQPAKDYEKETKKHPIMGTMADESINRRDDWLRNGCNAFDTERPKSKPMSFWTEQDVLQYIHDYGIEIAPVYGEVKQDSKGKFYTTGCHRTGCVFCMFGCHLEKEPNRFQQLKQTHPKLYEYCIRSEEDGGLGLGKVLDFIHVNYK